MENQERREGNPGQNEAGGKGRGPDAGSQRDGWSDDGIRQDVEDRLTHNPDIEADGIEVSVNHGDVVLLGNVKHQQSKRLAEEVAKTAPGVRSVRNDIALAQ